MKILIVDDESLSRDSLKSQLQKLHYDEILMADNGERALKLLEKELLELVFVDIRMPEMSGIELMEKAAVLGKNFIFIVLSGYDSFEYAQRAMELGAYKYLLKPIDDSKLQEAMKSVETKIKIRRTEKEKYLKLNQNITRNKNLLKKQYLYELLSANKNIPDHYDYTLQERPITFSKSIFQMCLLSIKEIGGSETVLKSEDQDIIQFGVENIINEIAEKYEIDAYYFSDGKMNGVLINHEQTDLNQQEIYQKIYTEIQGFLSFFKKSEITLGIGMSIQDIMKLQEAYSSAKEAVNQRLVRGNGRIYFADERQQKNEKLKDIKINVEETIIKMIYQGDREKINKYIDELYAPYLNTMFAEVKKINKMHLNIFVILHKELDKREIESSKVLEDEFLLYNQIQVLDSIEEMKEFLFKKILLCMDALKYQGDIGHDKIMQRAKEFIEENIGYQLTLENVAEHVNLSPAYFSKLFKYEVGMTFMDYSTKMRIKASKELLDQNMKTTEICNKIGFLDMKHFYKVFKKWEGMTPGQYKKGPS